MKITIVAGARPNFMKIAPIIEALEKAMEGKKTLLDYRLIHTGQHYDHGLSKTFFQELGIPSPHVNLEVGSGSHAQQTADIMVRFEEDLIKNPADLVMVVGDVNSTMACAIVAKKLCTEVAHVEAGIRSFDLSMPEEINRMVTDTLTDYFFTTTLHANQNLLNCGVPSEKIFHVGNTMIDTLLKNLPNLKKPSVWKDFNLRKREYFVLTLHRPSNVDEKTILETCLKEIINGTAKLPIIFPVHPRTKTQLGSVSNLDNLMMIKPLGYLDFIYLVKNAKAVITDSGGIQEETTVLNIPCITLRNNTERPETVEIGTNEIIGLNMEKLKTALDKILKGSWKRGKIPELWDGHAAKRIVNKLIELN